MKRSESGSGWEKVPAIRLIVTKRISIGPGGSYAWNQTGNKGPYWRIYWNDSPGSFISCGGEEIELNPQRVVALSPDATYSTRAEKLVKHFYVHCFVSQPFSEIKGKMFLLKGYELAKKAAYLSSKVNKDSDATRIQMELLVYLNSVLLAIPPNCIPKYTPYDPKVAKAIKILENHQKISNADLAQRVGMSRNGFLFLFKKVTNFSPQVYSRRLRINEACIMLNHSNRSIDEIALETGFCDRYHFSRAFRQVIGYAPGQFRSRACRYPNISR